MIISKNTIIFRFDKAIQSTCLKKRSELIDLGVEYNIIKKSGSWFSYNDTKLGQGRDAAKQILLDNPELFEEIELLIREQLKRA